MNPSDRFTCHWCLQGKPSTEFNAGHVIPQAFGKVDGNNIVLHRRECTACNKFLGDGIEQALARDSKEGLDRFEHGTVKPKKGPPGRGGHRVKITLRGAMDGAPMEMDPERPSGTLRFRPRRSVGVGASWEGPWQWYAPDRLPPASELRANGLFHFATAGSMSVDELRACVTSLGMSVGEARVSSAPAEPDGKVDTTMRGVIDTDLQRAVAKIAFNYFVHAYPAFRLMPHFHESRRYVRYGEAPSFVPVSIDARSIIAGVPSNLQIVVHVVTVQWDRRRSRVIAQVSLFGWLRYEVTLSAMPFIIAPTCIDSGHAFNTFTNQRLALTRDPLRGFLPHLVTKEAFELARAARGKPEAEARDRRGTHASTLHALRDSLPA